MAIFDIRPASVSPTYDTWTLDAGASKLIAVDPTVAFVDDDATSYLASPAASAGSPGTKQGFIMGTRPEIATITQVDVIFRQEENGANSGLEQLGAFIRIGGAEGAVNTVFLVSAWTTSSCTLLPPGGGAWSLKQLFDPTLELVWYMYNWAGEVGVRKCLVSTVRLRVTGTALPSQISETRERESAFLRFRRRAQVYYSFKNVTPDFLNMDPLEQVSVTHQAIPNAAGAGAGDTGWKRRLMRTVRASYNFNSRRMTLHCRDLRRDLVTFWDTGLAVRPGPTAHGVARWDIGCTRSHTRASKGWVLDAGLVVREVANDDEALGRNGQMIRRPHTNYLVQSSFRNGGPGSAFTGWTFSDGSGSHAEDTADLLFDPNVSARSLKLTAGSPHSTETTAAGTVTGTITANTVVSVFVEYKSSVTGSGAWAWRLQRGFDSKWWDGSAWQVAQQTVNVNPAAANIRSNAGSTVTAGINVGANNTTLTLTVLLPAGGTASRVVHFYHAQITDLPFYNGRIVTDAAAVTLAQERLLISNNNTARFWRKNSGSAQFRFTPNWSSGANVSGYTFTLASCVFDANNGMWLFYDGTNSRWVFRRKAAGVSYDAILSQSVTALTQHTISIRWASAAGEQDLPAFTQSVFRGSVKGTDVVSVAPTEVNTANAALGGEETTANTCDGEISNTVFTEQVLTDQEIAWGFW